MRFFHFAFGSAQNGTLFHSLGTSHSLGTGQFLLHFSKGVRIRDSTRLRCPTSACGDKSPCHLSTAAFSLRFGHGSALTIHRIVIHFLAAASLPCALASSATGGGQARFPLPTGRGFESLSFQAKRNRHPLTWMPVLFWRAWRDTDATHLACLSTQMLRISVPDFAPTS